jgi:hypothetical protein
MAKCAMPSDHRRGERPPPHDAPLEIAKDRLDVDQERRGLQEVQQVRRDRDAAVAGELQQFGGGVDVLAAHDHAPHPVGIDVGGALPEITHPDHDVFVHGSPRDSLRVGCAC